MYARQTSIELRPNKRKGFAPRMDAEVLPLLRTQKGFQDAITFFHPAGKDAIAVTLWEGLKSAEAHGRNSHFDMMKLLSNLIERTPRVRNHEVTNSTFHKTAATVTAA